jgi:tetratricopeptide (TPR) repeat protein
MRTLLRATSFFCALCIAAPVTAAAPPGMPTDPKAEKYMQRGREAYEKEDYDAAVEAFEKGYAIEPVGAFLYAQAQAERLRGRCREAVKLYNAFLATNPGAEVASLAKEAKSLCADELAAEGVDADGGEDLAEDDAIADTEPPDPVTPGPDEIEDDVSDERRGRRWYADPLGGTLVGVGVAGIGAGVGLIVAAQLEEGKQSPSYGDFADRVQRIETFRIAGGVVLGVGGALLIAGAVRWGILSARERRANVAVTLDRHLAGLTIRGRF